MCLRITIFISCSEPGMLFCDIGDREQVLFYPWSLPWAPFSTKLHSIFVFVSLNFLPQKLTQNSHLLDLKFSMLRKHILNQNFKEKKGVWGQTKLKLANKQFIVVFGIIHMLLYINKVNFNLTELYLNGSICSFPRFKQTSKLWLIPFQCFYVFRGWLHENDQTFDLKIKIFILCRKPCGLHVRGFPDIS